MRIGIFDSGIGGLTVLKSLIDKHPNNEYIYLGDTKNLPYGSKSYEQLLILAKKNIDFLIGKNVDTIIIACGTISSNHYDNLKNNYKIPLVDIITSAAKELKGYNKVLLIATEMTIKSEVFKQKLSNEGIKVIDTACPKFVPLIEGMITHNKHETIEEYLKEYKDSDIETIIPGCTHYPLLKREIEEYLNVPMFDIGGAIAKNIDIIDSLPSIELYFSSISDKLKDNVKNIMEDIPLLEAQL